MERRISWIMAGVAALFLIMLGAGFYLVREIQRQQQQFADLSATIAAGRDAAPAATALVPAATRTPLAEATVAASASTISAASAVPSTEPATPGVPVTSESSAAPGVIPDPSAAPQPDIAAALAPTGRGALAQHPNATLYRIGARLDSKRHTIDGAQTVHLTNAEDVPLDEIYFRLYVNAPHYNEGGIVVEDVRVGGQPAQTALAVGDTALKVLLAKPLAPGQSVEISMRFTATVPTSGGGYGIFNEAEGVFALYNWHPELAVYENGGWLLNPVTSQGDPTNTDSSNYIVAFAAPSAFQLVTSGIEVARTESDGQAVHRIAGALARNMVVVASDRFSVASRKIGDVTVNAYYLPGDEEGGNATLATATRSIELFSKQFGPYPYTELDVAEVKLGGGAAGMESTGLILIGSDFYSQPNPLAGLGALGQGAGGLSVLDFTTAHEIAHQWWYGVVGSDAYLHPWLDESLTNWSSAFYVDEAEGADAGAMARDVFISLPYRQVLAQGDEPLDQPVDKFSGFEYGAVVYGKGALMYDVLRKQLGDAKFFDFLRRYYEEHRFGRVDSVGWRDTLAQVAGQQAATAFYQKWVVGNAINQADLPPGGPMSDLLGQLNGLDSLLATPTPGK